MDQEWGNYHMVCTNIILPFIWGLLEERECNLHVISLLDNHSRAAQFSSEYYLDRYAHRPEVVEYEQNIHNSSLEVLKSLNKSRAVIGPAPTTHFESTTKFWLKSPTQPLLAERDCTTGHIRTSAALNDAVFQQKVQQQIPNRTVAITIHPRQGGYINQQPAMREVLSFIANNWQTTFINIFVTNKLQPGKITKTPTPPNTKTVVLN
jgi:hypothetical protein